MLTRVTLRIVGVLVASLSFLILFGAGAAHADGESIVGTLLTNSRAPVAGVTITVTNDSGFSESAVTETDGKFAIPVPKTGAYTVTLEESTLPEGIATPVLNPINTTVRPGTDRPVLFVLGERERNTQSTWDRAAQLFVEGLRFGLIIALAAVGLSLIYGTTGLTNFAHGEIVTFGAIIVWYFNVSLGIPLLIAAVLGVAASALFGGVMDRGLWKPLRGRGTGLIAMMIVSIGLALALRSIYQIFFGATSRAYSEYQGQAGLSFGPVDITPANLISMIIAAVILALAGLALLKTRTGKATRAVADNPALAATTGIDVERVILIVWVVGAALAGLGGFLLALNQQVSFIIGQQVLLLVFAAVTLGGLGTAFGALVGSIVVGLFITMSTLVIPTELQTVGALGILILVLLVKPAGILGRQGRVG